MRPGRLDVTRGRARMLHSLRREGLRTSSREMGSLIPDESSRCYHVGWWASSSTSVVLVLCPEQWHDERLGLLVTRGSLCSSASASAKMTATRVEMALEA